MEVEWDNGSLMDVAAMEGFQRIWGAVPEFVWPAVGDRVWVSGRWIFDCGHPGTPGADANDATYVKFSTEIHPPRAMVAFRLNHLALDSYPVARVSAPNFPYPQSYLPVTGSPVDPATLPSGMASTPPTGVPLTEADIYVSGNGGAASDICSIVPVPCSNYGGHTEPVLAVNDLNYVFDVYPPGTSFDFSSLAANGTFNVTPPVPDASLQWRWVDHSSELPAHTCGGSDTSGCVTVNPIVCLLDSSTPPPNQTETGCPAVPAHPTRLRVILPFAGSNANYFAQSLLLGWDDVPAQANQTPGVRSFQIRLSNLTVNDDGEGCCTDGDWRVFVNVGGQWRYISQSYDAKSDGTSVCNGADSLINNGNGDCFQFEKTPWTVSVQDGMNIHIAVGGFEARGVEDSGNPLFMCRNYPGGCDAPTSFSILSSPFIDFAFSNDDRIGTYEFDLQPPDYAPPAAFTTAQFGCSVFSITGCSLRYSTQFTVEEITAPTPPSSAPLVIGIPSYTGNAGIYFAASTPMIPQTADSNVEGFQYRFHRQGAALPTYQTSPFPIHWAHVDLASGVHSAEVRVEGANSGDGPYDFQYSAESFNDLLEPRHTATFILDTTPPVTTIAQPAANTQYGHSDTLVLTYSEDDGTGSGVNAASVTPTMDTQAASQFCNSVTCLNSGQSIYLESMSLGAHNFAVSAADNVGNAGTTTAPFTIVVTFNSLLKDVTNLQALGCIGSMAPSLTAKFSAAESLYGKGQLHTAINILSAAIAEVQAQAGKQISSTCHDPLGRTFDAVQFLLGDIRYLMASIAGQIKPNPIQGSVVISGNAAIAGVTVSLMSGKTLLATATTDSAGFYYFADTSFLTAGSSYTAQVTAVPKGYKTSTPASQTFKWGQAALTLANFVLN